MCHLQLNVTVVYKGADYGHMSIGVVEILQNCANFYAHLPYSTFLFHCGNQHSISPMRELICKMYSGPLSACTRCRAVAAPAGIAAVGTATASRLGLLNCAIRPVVIGWHPVWVRFCIAEQTNLYFSFSPARMHVETPPSCNDVTVLVVGVTGVVYM